MRQYDYVQLLGNSSDVLDDFLDFFGPAGDGAVDATIDQHPKIPAPILLELEQMAVTNALTIKTYRRFCSTRSGRCDWRWRSCVAGRFCRGVHAGTSVLAALCALCCGL
jgi:hypothetical protein